MESIKLKGRIDDDGILRLEVPVGRPGVTVVFQRPEMTQEEWEKFINETSGSLADDPIERGDQGEFEVRDEIL